MYNYLIVYIMILHLTENHQLKAADALISKLKQQNAANEEYIAELEEGLSPKYEQEIAELKKKVKDLESTNKSLKTQYTQLNTLYAQLLQNPELHIEKYTNKIKELEKQIKEYYKIRDELIYKLNSKNE